MAFANKLRVATIRFLNPAPLMWDFEHPPRAAELAERYVLEATLPSECAARLASGDADVGLIPIAAYATTPGLAIVPGCAIASRARVRSILLVVKGELKDVKRVSADTASRSSVAYAQILFHKFLGMRPEFVRHVADVEEMLAEADAALVIGDPALLALERRDAIEAHVGGACLWIDLAEEWTTRTGLPWVAAFWAVRQESVDAASATQLVEDLQRSRDAGLAHVEKLVAEWTTRIALTPDVIRTYLTENIAYVLDEECIRAIQLFYAYAAECGALPAAPPLRFL